MNAMPQTMARPLLDILGARWRVGVAAAAVAWDTATGLAGFALSDGTLAIAHPVWPGAPTVRPAAGGGVEVVPGTAAAPPAARVKAHANTCVSVAADPGGGFLTGGTDGRVMQVQVDGTVRALAHQGGPISMVVAGPGRWRAFALRDSVHRVGGAADQIKLPGPVSALALSPDGSQLAIGQPGGVTIWAGGDAPRVLAATGHPCGLQWSTDGTFLACFLEDGTLRAWHWPTTVASDIPAGSVAALCPVAGGGFAAGLAGRVVYWAPPAPQTYACGVPNQSAVTRLGGHPSRRLVAAGYANGAVVLCRPSDTGFMLLRGAGEGAVRALRFSPSGEYLAIGTDGREIALLTLPDALFRDRGERR